MRSMFLVSLMLLACAQAPATSLLEAAQAGDVESTLARLREGENASAAAPDGTTALHWAAHHGSRTLTEALIKAGADVKARSEFGITPMSEAAGTGDAVLIDMLLKAGAEVESPNADGQTALMTVARGAHLEAARLLLKRGANVNAVEQWRGQTALMWAAAQSQPEMVALLLKSGANPNARSAVNENARQITAEPRAMYRPAGGLTPLLFAARVGCIECARALIKGGAAVDLEDPEGVTPLLVAIDNLRFDLAAFLLSVGAAPDKWDWRGRSPLYLAIDMNTLPHGGRPDRPSLDRLTGLDVARLLLDAGANANLRLKLHPGYREVKDDRGADRMLTIGTTPLLRAAKAFDVEAMKLLLAHGADTELANINGVTPLMAAAGLASRVGDTRGVYDSADVEQRSLAAVRVLLAAGANVNARARDGRTAATGAATWGWKEVSAALAAAGASAPARSDSDTPRASRPELAQQ